MGKGQDLLFGAIAVSTGCISRDQLDELLEEQTRSDGGLTLGELCLKKGLLSPKQVRHILEVQRSASVPDEKKSLGALAVESGFATEAEVELALQAQKEGESDDPAGPPLLGEVLLAMGTLNLQKLRALLALQARLRDGHGISTTQGDLETRVIPIATDLPEAPEEPVAWLIDEKTGESYRVGRGSFIGRLPQHDVPVADMGASRHHARIAFSAEDGRHVISDLDSRNGTSVNGRPVTEPRVLNPGDRIRVGDTIFRYAPGFAAPAAPAPAVEAAPPPAEAAAAQTPSGPPKERVHRQRALVSAAAVMGLASTFLPWVHVSGAGWVSGARDVGWLTFAFLGGVVLLATLKDRERPLAEWPLLGALVLSISASLFGFFYLVALALKPGEAAGVGLYFSVLSALAVSAALALGAGRPSDVVRALARGAGALLGRLRPKDGGAAGASPRRAELLRDVGEAALRARIAGPESVAAARAQEHVDAARRHLQQLEERSLAASEPEKAAATNERVRARSAVKEAETRLERALEKLGKHVVDQGIELDGAAARVAELRALETRPPESA
jgi:hypothetical protein